MSGYGYTPYRINKIDFPKESFLIAGISFYQNNLESIQLGSELIMKYEPDNKYDSSAIQILFNDKCIGYVPRNDFFKKLCNENINSFLRIINIKKDPESNNYGVRVILDKYYTDELKSIGLF